MFRLVNLNSSSVPLALRTRPGAAGPHASLDFLHEPGRGEPLENALGRVERYVEPLCSVLTESVTLGF